MPIFDIKTHDKTVNDFEPCEVTRIAHDLGEFTSYYTIAERDGVFYFLSEEVLRTKQRPDTLKPLQPFGAKTGQQPTGILKFNETMKITKQPSTLRQRITTEADYFLVETVRHYAEQLITQERLPDFPEIQGKFRDFLQRNFIPASKQEFILGVARGLANYKQFVILTHLDVKSPQALIFKKVALDIADVFGLEFDYFCKEKYEVEQS